MYPGYYQGIIRVKNGLDLGWELGFLFFRGMFVIEKMNGFILAERLCCHELELGLVFGFLSVRGISVIIRGIFGEGICSSGEIVLS